MTDKEKATIQAVIRTLDSVTVNGLENMNKILGCATALQTLLSSEDPPKEAE